MGSGNSRCQFFEENAHEETAPDWDLLTSPRAGHGNALEAT